MTKKRYSFILAKLSLFLLLMVINIFFGCSQNSKTIVLSKNPLMLSSKPIVLKLEQPLRRSNNSLSIRMQLKESWSIEPSWRDIKLQDGTLVKIKATLISDKGTQYHPVLIGSGGGLDIRFSDSVPQDERIVKIIFSSTHPLTVQKVSWVDWDPK